MNGMGLALITLLGMAWVVIYHQHTQLRTRQVDSDLSDLSREYYVNELQWASNEIARLTASNTALLLTQAECRCADRDSRKAALTVVGKP